MRLSQSHESPGGAEAAVVGAGAVGDRSVAWQVLAVGVVAAVVPLLYAGYTQHVWEDYLITFRFSANLAAGRGLVYNIGERVHGFTSPLGVLLPALIHWLDGQRDVHVTLWIFRVLTAGAFGAAVALVYDALRRGGVGLGCALMTVGLFLLEPKSVAYSANGQEAGFMMLGVAACLWLSLADVRRRWWAWGVALGFLQWTRPDGFVFWGAYAVTVVVFPGAGATRRETVAALAKAAGVGLVIYAPWLVFTTAYYGSPVPQTVVAKAALMATAPPTWGERVGWLPGRLAGPYRPIYYTFGKWPAHVTVVAGLIATVGALAWVAPVRWVGRTVRVASLAFLLTGSYFAFVVFESPWYLPPFALPGLAAFAPAVAGVGRRVAGGNARARRMVGAGVAVVVAGVVTERLVYSVGFDRQIRAQQAIIEDGTRAPLGRWLREHVPAGETVYLEPLGYIGYYSGAHMADFPGLVSPRVSRIVREHRYDPFYRAPKYLRPDWMVLRGREAGIMSRLPFFGDYERVAVFDSTARVAAVDVPGVEYLYYDARYEVYRRKAVAGTTTRQAATTEPRAGVGNGRENASGSPGGAAGAW